jgi:ABC-type lipoprotein release transport system permease subunit
MFSVLNFRVGWYLAVRQIRRSSKWTTGLTVFVMLLTFLNLTVITGVLVGLVEGINESYREQFIGDVIISPLDTKSDVEHTPEILSFLSTLPAVDKVSARYSSGG